MDNSQPLNTRVVSKRRLLLKRSLFIGLPLVLVLFAAMYFYMSSIPANLDTTTSKASTNGLYQVAYYPNEANIPINRLQTWTLQVTTPNGEVVEDATITVDGDMPQHGHGLATSPLVSSSGDGNYLVEGLKFQMGGWWFTEFDIRSPRGEDTVRFDFVLK